MNRKLWIRTALIATPLVAFLLYAALNWYRIEETTVRLGMREEALRDPYLAFSKLLARMGASASFTKSPSHLAAPPERGVLMLGSRRLAYMTPTRVRELEAWVKRGGVLVAAAEPHGIDDPLLERFGVEREPQPDPSVERRKRAGERNEPRAPVASVVWPGATGPLRVRQFGVGIQMRDDEDEPEQLVSARIGQRTVLLAFVHGQGRVAFLSDLRFLRNRAIGDLDHAQLGWRLASAAPEKRTAMIFLSPESPSLWQWLVDEAWPVLIASAVLFVFWLARIMPRFGPLAPEAPPVRRSLLEHLLASGRYLWSRAEGAYLLDALRDRAWRTALRRRGGLRGMAHSKAHAALADISGTSSSVVERAMHGSDTSPAGFLATASALQTIEAGLAHRTRTSIRKRKGNAP